MTRKEWSDCAYDALVRYAQTTHQFTTEQFRTDCVHIPQPDDPRDWGIPVRRATKAGLIAAGGYTSAGKVAHNRPVVIWRSNAA